MSKFVDSGTEERRTNTEDIRNGKSAFKHTQGVYTNDHNIIYFILTYNFSEFSTAYLILPYNIRVNMSAISPEDIFPEVTRTRKKRKANNSPTLPRQPKPGFSKPSPGTPVRPRSSHKNKIPVIISDVDDKFKSWKQLMGELRQYYPSLKVSSIKALPKGNFVIIGDSMQEVILLQSETKMKAALGQKVKVSLPKAFQTSNVQNRSLAVKGVPTDITEAEFKEFFDLNKISFAKAELI